MKQKTINEMIDSIFQFLKKENSQKQQQRKENSLDFQNQNKHPAKTKKIFKKQNQTKGIVQKLQKYFVTVKQQIYILSRQNKFLNQQNNILKKTNQNMVQSIKNLQKKTNQRSTYMVFLQNRLKEFEQRLIDSQIMANRYLDTIQALRNQIDDFSQKQSISMSRYHEVCRMNQQNRDRYLDIREQMQKLTFNVNVQQKLKQNRQLAIQELEKYCQINQIIISCYNWVILNTKLDQKKNQSKYSIFEIDKKIQEQINLWCMQLTEKTQVIDKFNTRTISHFKKQYQTLKLLTKFESPIELSKNYICTHESDKVNAPLQERGYLFGYKLSANYLFKLLSNPQFSKTNFQELKWIVNGKHFKNGKISDKDFKTFILNASLYPNLSLIDLSENNITQIRKQDIQKFQKLTIINLKQNPLSKESINELKEYQLAHPNVIVKYDEIMELK